MFSSKKVSVVLSMLAVSVAACTLPTGLGQQQSTTQVSYSYSADVQLPLLPESAWTQNGGPIHPVCSGGSNPHEVSFTNVAAGVSLASASDRVDCCTCTQRSRPFAITRIPTQGAHIHGTMVVSRGANDVYSVASLRITAKDGGATVASRVVAGEIRGNNNCAGSSEQPELLLDKNGDFDLDLGAMAPGKNVDEIDVDLMGYACGNAANEVTLENLHVLSSGSSTGAPPAPAPAPAPAPQPAGTPDLASSFTPSTFSSYATGTIGRDNSGFATIVNNGSGTANGVTVDIHTESNNPYGPVAPFRQIDPRCISVSSGNNAYLCTIGSMAPGASTTIAFTFNSFNDTTVVAIAKDTNGDANFADNRSVAHVY